MKKNILDIILRVLFIISFLAIVIIIFLAIYMYVDTFGGDGPSPNLSDWGTFGDYMGGTIGSILGFASIVLVCFTFVKQNNSQILQQFESTFFNLLLLQIEIKNSIRGCLDVGEKGLTNKLTGGEYINELVKYIYSENFQSDYCALEYKQYLLDRFEDLDQAEQTLGFYFRHLYHIFKYVDESNIPDKMKNKYIGILQAQMNDNELHMCFLNSFSKYGIEKFYPILSKYNFFENIRSKNSHFDKLKVELYPNTKFKFNTVI
jgi:hypothetical protein